MQVAPESPSRPGPIPAGTVIDIGDHSVEVLETPAETRDRYRLRIVAEPGGGPGIEGDDQHLHPMLQETFTCISGGPVSRGWEDDVGLHDERAVTIVDEPMDGARLRPTAGEERSVPSMPVAAAKARPRRYIGPGSLGVMRNTTAQLWAKQDRHPDDRHQLFQTVATALDADTVLYAGSWCDVVASFVWPSVTYVDSDRQAARFFSDPDGVREVVTAHADANDPQVRFIPADYTEPLPLEAESFDLLLSLYAGPVSRHCTGYLRVGGMLLANSSHGDVALASVDPRYQLTGVIRAREGRYHYVTDELESYLVPKTPVEDIAETVGRTGRGIAYTRSPYAYLFRRVR